jgi:hypothetical protein
LRDQIDPSVGGLPAQRGTTMATKKLKSLLRTAGSTAYVRYSYQSSQFKDCEVNEVLVIRNARTEARAEKALEKLLGGQKIYWDGVFVTFFLYEAFKDGTMPDRVREIDANTGALIE